MAAPSLFGRLIASGEPRTVFYGYRFGAARMLAADVIAALYAVRAERRTLEDVATPLSAAA